MSRSDLSNCRLITFAVIVVAMAGIFLSATYIRSNLATKYPLTLLPGFHAEGHTTHDTLKSAVKHLYFLKTHKCASTTVQRIFMLYAIRNNLSIALPLRESNNFFPLIFQPEIAKRTCSHPHFDVVAAHARFHPSARAYMPRNTFYVSIVRDPAEQMESTFYYFLVKFCDASRYAKLTFESYMRRLIQMPPRSRLPPVRYPCGVDNMQFIQLYDFGLELDPLPTREIVQSKIVELDSDFHLVLVVERLDEGLIILRDMLGWSTEDMVFLKSNYRLSATSNMSTEARAAAYAWNWGDKMLYDHFRAKMDAMIEHQEEYLRAEVHKFRELQASFYRRCVASTAAGTESSSGNKTKSGPSVLLSSYELNDQGRGDDRCRIAAISEYELFLLMNKMYQSCPQNATTTSRMT